MRDKPHKSGLIMILEVFEFNIQTHIQINVMYHIAKCKVKVTNELFFVVQDVVVDG